MGRVSQKPDYVAAMEIFEFWHEVETLHRILDDWISQGWAGDNKKMNENLRVLSIILPWLESFEKTMVCWED
jgi:hypothetical protein